MFLYIKKYRTLQGAPFCKGECIKWMTMKIVLTISNLDKDDPLSLTSDDINLPSLDLIISRKNFQSFSFEISDSDILSSLSERASREFLLLCHRKTEYFQLLRKYYFSLLFSIFLYPFSKKFKELRSEIISGKSIVYRRLDKSELISRIISISLHFESVDFFPSIDHTSKCICKPNFSIF